MITQKSNTKIKLIPFDDSKNLSQIYIRGFEFAFCKPVGTNRRLFKQLHPFVLCKDFLHDVVWSSINGKSYRLYGFSFDPAVDDKEDRRASLVRTFILVRDKTKSIKEISNHISRSKELLNRIEDVCKFSHTIAREVMLQGNGASKTAVKPAPTGCFVLEGDNRWMLAPPLLSIYTTLIRAGKSYEGEDPIKFVENLSSKTSERDGDYLKNVKDNGLIPLIFKENVSLFNNAIKDNYPAHLSHSVIHNNLGIVGYSKMFFCKKAEVEGWTVSNYT